MYSHQQLSFVIRQTLYWMETLLLHSWNFRKGYPANWIVYGFHQVCPGIWSMLQLLPSISFLFCNLYSSHVV